MFPRLLLATILCCFAWLGIGSPLAQSWEQLGPQGGYIHFLASDPAGNGKLYAALGARIFASTDNGLTWVERMPVPECPSPLSLKVRAGGDVFINCYHRNLRSRDGASTWSVYSPPARLLVDFELAFDPHDAQRATLRRGLDYVWRIATTSDDGLTWTAPVPAADDVVPTFVAFDPRRPGRLVGVGTVQRTVNGSTEYATQFFDSRDDGAHWTPFAVIWPQGASACYERQFVVHPGGHFLLATDCGFLRSRDGGTTWERAASPGSGNLVQVQAEPGERGRLVALDAAGELHASNDLASSWQALPADGQRVLAFTTTLDGTVVRATAAGVSSLPPAAASWIERTHGIHTRVLAQVEAAGTSPRVLLAVEAPGKPGLRSLDDGAHWSAFDLDGRPVASLVRSLTDRDAVYATTADGALHASSDGGLGWRKVTDRMATRADDQVGGIMAIAGVLYGLAFDLCPPSVLPGCSPQARNLARSIDGGITWSRVAGGPTLTAGHSAWKLLATPANAAVVLMSTSAGVLATFDAGATFTNVLPEGGVVAIDPVDARQWYAVDRQQTFLVTSDGGVQWRPLPRPPVAGLQFDLVIDSRDPARLYAVGIRGDVAASRDRGLTWTIVVPPSLTLGVAPGSVRADGGAAATTLVAASDQGMVRMIIAADAPPALVRAVEYYRATGDHYFVTTDPYEIAGLDSGSIGGWVRTGIGFDVLAANATAPFTSPVCRFYGRPERGLDSHFYSALPAECAAVAARFGDAWILESDAVFRAYLPASADGLCPSRTTPVYRLYNGRADANHRYTMWPTLREEMLAAGWISEGFGPYGVAMCAPW